MYLLKKLSCEQAAKAAANLDISALSAAVYNRGLSKHITISMDG